MTTDKLLDLARKGKAMITRKQLVDSLSPATRKVVITEPPFATEFPDDSQWFVTNSAIPDGVLVVFGKYFGYQAGDPVGSLHEALKVGAALAQHRVNDAQKHLDKFKTALKESEERQ